MRICAFVQPQETLSIGNRALEWVLKKAPKWGMGEGGMATEMGTKIAQWGQLGKGHMQQGTKIGMINGHLNRLGNRIINGVSESTQNGCEIKIR